MSSAPPARRAVRGRVLLVFGAGVAAAAAAAGWTVTLPLSETLFISQEPTSPAYAGVFAAAPIERWSVAWLAIVAGRWAVLLAALAVALFAPRDPAPRKLVGAAGALCLLVSAAGLTALLLQDSQILVTVWLSLAGAGAMLAGWILLRRVAGAEPVAAP